MSKEPSFDEQVAGAAVAAREQAGQGGVTPDEFSMMLAAAHYLYRDDNVDRMIFGDGQNRCDERLKKLAPALSHLIRTSRIVNEKDLRLMKLRWRLSVRLTLLVEAERKNVASYAEFYAWVNFGEAVIDDTFEGWRGRLVTERIRTYKIEQQQGSRKKLFGIIPYG